VKTLLASLFVLASAVYGQGVDSYIATASTTALTMQQPPANGRQITFGSATLAGASVYCLAAQTATLSWNGTPATATAGSEVLLPGTQRPSGMTVWTASNVGSGTTGPIYNVGAGATFPLDLSRFSFGTQGSAQNLTIATSGTCTITFSYSAARQ
jgi:hypothetical protein